VIIRRNGIATVTSVIITINVIIFDYIQTASPQLSNTLHHIQH